jgi:hypothetical protein
MDSGTESGSECEEMLEQMTKEDLLYLLRRSRCSMMLGRNPRFFTKEELIEHLVKHDCPVIRKIMKVSHKK